jgi:hypothetical protein
MNKKLKSLIAVTFLLGLRVAANADIRDQVLVKLPFEFVVSGTTLPAGTYTVKCLVQQQSNLLLLTNNDNRRSILVHPTERLDASNDMAKVRFRKVGEQRFLSAIQTPEYLYNFPLSPSSILETPATTAGGR